MQNIGCIKKAENEKRRRELLSLKFSPNLNKPYIPSSLLSIDSPLYSRPLLSHSLRRRLPHSARNRHKRRPPPSLHPSPPTSWTPPPTAVADDVNTTTTCCRRRGEDHQIEIDVQGYISTCSIWRYVHFVWFWFFVSIDLCVCLSIWVLCSKFKFEFVWFWVQSMFYFVLGKQPDLAEEVAAIRALAGFYY